MDYALLDDPAIVLPRLMDVHGTFRRLGFVYWGKNRVRDGFYRQFVPLYAGVASPAVRQISHLNFTVRLSDEEEHAIVMITYGFPFRIPGRRKIREGFHDLTGKFTLLRMSLRGDKDLRETEKRLAQAIDTIKTKAIDLSDELPSQGVVTAVARLFGTGYYSSGARFVVESGCYIPVEPEECESSPPRLPNFTRRQDYCRAKARLGR